jgi:hypothetical protein
MISTTENAKRTTLKLKKVVFLMKTTVYSTAKILAGLINYYVFSDSLNINIFSIDVMNTLWDDDKFAPTLPEFSEGIDRLCCKGILTKTDTGYLLTDKLHDFSKAALITAAHIYDGISSLSDGIIEAESFFDDEEDMNEYAVMRGSRLGDVDIYDAREFLLSTGLARITADGIYISIR